MVNIKINYEEIKFYKGDTRTGRRQETGETTRGNKRNMNGVKKTREKKRREKETANGGGV